MLLEKIIVNTQHARSEILVGQDWVSVGGLLPQSGVVIITDTNVQRLYGDRFPDFPVITIKAGEASKKLEEVEAVAQRLLDSGIDRSGFILAIGGGVVCDISGFLASVYMRGIRCGYVASTLLAQVDASTGGKNGVNLGNYKNVIGCFKQPEFVVCDTALLKSLPEEEYYSGVSELIKTAIIGDEKLFELIEHNQAEIKARDPEFMAMLVSMSVGFKASVVSEDEKETGNRRVLNFGHTYGHAIEMYKSYKHGFAVASGMELATLFSLERGYINKTECERIVSLLRIMKLLRPHSIPDNQIDQYIMHDKKKAGLEIHFVFTAGIGRTIVEKLPVSEVVGFYKRNRGLH